MSGIQKMIGKKTMRRLVSVAERVGHQSRELQIGLLSCKQSLGWEQLGFSHTYRHIHGWAFLEGEFSTVDKILRRGKSFKMGIFVSDNTCHIYCCLPGHCFFWSSRKDLPASLLPNLHCYWTRIRCIIFLCVSILRMRNFFLFRFRGELFLINRIKIWGGGLYIAEDSVLLFSCKT